MPAARAVWASATASLEVMNGNDTRRCVGVVDAVVKHGAHSVLNLCINVVGVMCEVSALAVVDDIVVSVAKSQLS